MITAKQNSAAIGPCAFADKKPPSPAYIRESQSKRLKAKGHAKRIFVIDDETRIADSLSEILTDYGYEALAFYNGYAAIDSAKARCPDAVISDVVMPKLNGVDTAVAIQELCPKARIILFSGQTSVTDLLEKARARGHNFELLSKPIHPDHLLKRLSADKT